MRRSAISASPTIRNTARIAVRRRAQPNRRENAARKVGFFVERFVVTSRVRITVKRAIQSFLGNRRRAINTDHFRIGWVVPGLDLSNDYKPPGVAGGIARSLQNMRALADLLAAKKIPLTIVVYPWAQQLAQGDRNSRQGALAR